MRPSLTIAVVFLLSLPAEAQNDCVDGNCGQLPVPSECSRETIDLAKAQAQMLLKNAQDKIFKASGSDEEAVLSAQSEINPYVEFLSFVAKCESRGKAPPCSAGDGGNYNFDFFRDMGHGWQKKFRAYFTIDPNGKCSFSPTSFYQADLNSPSGNQVFNVVPSKNGTSYMPSFHIPCQVKDSAWKTKRQLAITNKRVTMIDWTLEEYGLPAGQNYGRNLNFKEPLTIRPVAQSAERFRLQWEGGSGDPLYLEYGQDGAIVGSNFLEEKDWTSGKCFAEKGQNRKKQDIYFPSDVRLQDSARGRMSVSGPTP